MPSVSCQMIPDRCTSVPVSHGARISASVIVSASFVATFFSGSALQSTFLGGDDAFAATCAAFKASSPLTDVLAFGGTEAPPPAEPELCAESELETVGPAAEDEPLFLASWLVSRSEAWLACEFDVFFFLAGGGVLSTCAAFVSGFGPVPVEVLLGDVACALGRFFADFKCAGAEF